MKKYILLLFLGVTITLKAQEIKLDIPDVRQKETNWCWAAVSQCVLNYYGYSSIQQCEVAEYAREIGIWHNYGETPCCEDASQGCNKGAFNCSDEIEENIVHDILVRFGNIGNTCEGVLWESHISNNLTQYRPFIMMWSKGSGSGHMVVGYGMIYDFSQGYPIHYMDPATGNAGGYKTLSYENLKNNGKWKWDKTIVLTKSPVPQHCFNCDKDPNEVEIDCGGPCPSCEDAPKQKSYVTSNSNLPPETRATQKITAGNAAVKVLSGQSVSFITSEEGSIVLLPGFEAAAGSNFSTQIKNNSSNSFTRVCGKYCGAGTYHSSYYKYQESFHIHDLVNIYKIEIKVYTVVTGQLLYSGVVYVTRDGTIDLWDFSGSGNSSVYCIAYLEIYPCDWHSSSYEAHFWVLKGSKSLDEEIEEHEKSDTFLSPPVNDITLQDENSTQTFSVIPNPNSGTFQLETNFPISDIGNLKITNPLGATIYEMQNLFSNTIQLPASASGLHFVVVMLKDGTVLTQKMMIQR